MSFITEQEYLSWLQREYIYWAKDPWVETKKKWKHAIAQKWNQMG
jgi:hypothetical protein